MSRGLLVVLCAAFGLCGCYDAHSRNQAGAVGSGAGDAAGSGAGGTENRDPAIEPVERVKTGILDLLFVIDNSESMKDEQVRLRAELPRMLLALTSGDLNPDDGIEKGRDFAPVVDLHLAVVSTDPGYMDWIRIIGPDITYYWMPSDEGRFWSQGNIAGDPNLTCLAYYETDEGYPFISFFEGEDIDALAMDVKCITAVGTGGCPFEMQLEAPLRALWPSEERHLTRAQKDLGITFFKDYPPRGDAEHRAFLRGTSYHPTQSAEPSVLAIVLLTDEEDCSAGAQGNLDFLEHGQHVPPEIAEQPPLLRCYYDTMNNTGNQYPVQRYVDAFNLLRPGLERLVVFAAIAGIPTSPAESDFDQDGNGKLDDRERDAYYQAILDHPSMQERIREDGLFLKPACTLSNAEYDPDDPNGVEFVTKGYPARRITQVVRGFGENGLIRSVCSGSYADAVDDIVRVIAKHLDKR